MNRQDKTAYRKGLALTALGIEIAGIIVTTALVGYKLDQWLKTEPWILVLMVILGSVAAFWRLIRLARWFDNRDSG